jgi:3-keto-5-aminohexanoate cleavage enzyme
VSTRLTEGKLRELRTTEKLIITVAPTGGFQGKEANPNLPVLPEEIAEAAYESWNEGASIVHIHARDRITHKRTTEPDVLREIDERIRAKNCDIIIQHSTADDLIIHDVMALGTIPTIDRIKTIEMNPEMASLDITVSGMIAFGGKEELEVVRLSDIEYGAKEMLDRGIKPELELFNPVLMEDIYHLIAKGLLKKPYWISFVMGMRRLNRTFMQYSPRLLMQLIDALPPDSMFTVLGIAGEELRATTMSILLGGHLRVGFEDNVFYKKGELAESNAQLVARAARIGRELGCEIATPSEARAMLGIPPL